MAKNAADQRQIVTSKLCGLTRPPVPEKNFMTDVFMVTGFEHDSNRLGLRLSSPLDAIGGDVPRRRLTES